MFRKFTFTVRELREFARKWPEFGVPRRRLTFEFDSIGNLVDVIGDEGLATGAVIALLEDARKRLFEQ